MEYVALAGYDVEQAAAGWRQVAELQSRLAREESAALGAWAEQIRAARRMAADMERMHMTRTLGTSGLVRTPRVSPVAQAELCREFLKLEEVRDARADRGAESGAAAYREFLLRALLPRAERAFADEDYTQAGEDYRNLYDKGVRTAALVHGLARSELGGDFAFSASNAKKEQAEQLYREATQLDASFAPAHRSLAELYEDWDRYADAIASYREYLRLNPDASDRARIERRVSVLERKAKR
jgi:tetratricopeptide (TPR) repeat protein